MELISGAFSAIRREHDSVLNYFAVFAALYGVRLWIQANLLGRAVHGSAFYPRLASALNYIVPIPAFLFFDAPGLRRRSARILSYVMGIIVGSLAVMTFAFGPSPTYQLINNVVVITAPVALLVRSLWPGSVSRDFLIIRRGLVIFAVSALFDNVAGPLRLGPKIKPCGFVGFLGALGYVAARQMPERDQQRNDIQRELEVARRIQLSILPAEFPSSTKFSRGRALRSHDFGGRGLLRLHRRRRHSRGTAHRRRFRARNASGADRLHGEAGGDGTASDAVDPSGLLSGMNAALCGNTQNEFVTAAYVHLDSASPELRYSAAGHPPMLLLREENRPTLAAFDFATYSTAAQPLEPGDRRLLYTDGIVEAASASGEFFGQESLRSLLRQTSGTPPADASDRIIATI